MLYDQSTVKKNLQVHMHHLEHDILYSQWERQVDISLHSLSYDLFFAILHQKIRAQLSNQLQNNIGK